MNEMEPFDSQLRLPGMDNVGFQMRFPPRTELEKVKLAKVETIERIRELLSPYEEAIKDTYTKLQFRPEYSLINTSSYIQSLWHGEEKDVVITFKKNKRNSDIPLIATFTTFNDLSDSEREVFKEKLVYAEYHDSIPVAVRAPKLLYNGLTAFALLQYGRELKYLDSNPNWNLSKTTKGHLRPEEIEYTHVTAFRFNATGNITDILLNTQQLYSYRTNGQDIAYSISNTDVIAYKDKGLSAHERFVMMKKPEWHFKYRLNPENRFVREKNPNNSPTIEDEIQNVMSHLPFRI